MMMEAQTGLMQREEFGAMQQHQSASTAEGAIAAQLQAAVQARYVMALRRPREWLHVRALLLKECARLRFAQSAIYCKPIGGDKVATGLSIRFAEAILRCAGNLSPEISILHDDDRKRLVRIQVSDLETNVTYSQDVVIEKTTEKTFLRKGQRAISERTNSRGQISYLVQASEGELLTKEAAQISKTLRTLVLRLLPGDIADDCRDAIERTIAAGDEKDPQAAIKAVTDGFMMIHVSPAQLGEYLGDDVSRASPAQIGALRKIYTAIRDGEVTWGEMMETKRAAAGSEDEESKAPAEPLSRGKALAQRIKAKAKDAAPQPAEEPAQKPAQPEPAGEEDDDYEQRAARMIAKRDS